MKRTKDFWLPCHQPGYQSLKKINRRKKLSFFLLLFFDAQVRRVPCHMPGVFMCLKHEINQISDVFLSCILE